MTLEIEKINAFIILIPTVSSLIWYLSGIITSALLMLIWILLPKNMVWKKHKSEYIEQSTAIKLERQRISEELHDELGSGLSAVKLYSELATKNNNEIVELKELSDMIKELSVKINDIIWTTSTENDQFDSVIFYMQEQLSKLFKHSNIHFESNLPDLIPFLQIKSESRRDFYLMAKEIAHNALKHSLATRILFEIEILNDTIVLVIKDNGKGFDPLTNGNAGMGLASINNRVKRLDGALKIENYKGTKVRVEIPISGNFYTLARKKN